ncbi:MULTISPECIES: iron-sulfur cluster carrier protein ApbC [unclassified Pseudoalteromonas]|uniref:iron-sulfur cluster carrier protein ApbC n=1 Tax=unclassified Pseudoalteromonas TaxID=194690 RepID=UPI000CF688C3|nr:MULTISPECIES: iron-sulfur cluster carrier protein ApbC [unclassified Pseudoalteromonas]
MFGLGSGKKPSLFSKRRGSQWQEEYRQHLGRYRSAAFPVGVPETAVQASSEQGLCRLVMPFACAQEAPELGAFLSKQLSRQIQVEIEVQLAEKPRFANIKHIIMVASGKGGVGKSTCAVNLAMALRHEGARVGILDADIYGPSIPLLLGLQGQKPQAKDEKTLLPMEAHGLKAQSIGFLVDPDDATVWRGPMASQALVQLLNETQWGELDYLIVDMPPGTGDIQLTMSQKVPASGAVIITTPQDLALADAQKGVAMFNKVNVPIIGLMENMSQFQCPHCGESSHIFGADGALQLSQRYGVPILAQLPLAMEIRQCSEQGGDLSDDYQDMAAYFAAAARLCASQLYYQQGAQQGVDIIITDD